MFILDQEPDTKLHETTTDAPGHLRDSAQL